jgi:dethiobiotin synthetase
VSEAEGAVLPITIISGTGTGVGKTIVTAALAALAAAGGERVAVVKPAQTGIDTGEETDLETVRRLTGVTDLHELARFPDPLSPEAAARTAGLPPLDLAAAARYIRELAATRDRVLVEGAGGLLVRYHPSGCTIADLAAMLDAPVLVVTAAGLGTLNHTALTLEALATRGLRSAGVVIGSWPAEPGLAELSNVTDLPILTSTVLTSTVLTSTVLTSTVLTGGSGTIARVPEGAGQLGRDEFLATARASLSL